MLKKCVAFMALFAVVAGAAFAQVTIGGQLQEGVTLLSGNNLNDSDVMVGSSNYHEAKLSALFGDGTAGGRLVMYAKGGFWGWMQWRPNQYFRVKIGSDGDGEGGFAQIVGWGFTGEAKNSVGAVSDYSGGLKMRYRNAGLGYGGFDGDGEFHVGLWFYPIDDLSVTLLFRKFNDAVEVSEKLARAQLYASYRIEEVGTIRFAYQGNGGLMKDAAMFSDIGTLWLAFHSSEIVQGLAFEVGANFNLPRKDSGSSIAEFNSAQEKPVADLSTIAAKTINGNINVAAGINLTSTDPFNLKVRTNVAFGGKERYNDGFQDQERDLPFGWGIGILPSYKLPKMTVFFHAGMGLERTPGKLNDKGELDEIAYEWFVNPYIWVPMGGMRMWAGIQIITETTDKRDDGSWQFKWAIPFGFNFYF